MNIENTPFPPFLPFLFIWHDEGITEVSWTIRELFERLNIEVKDKEPTQRILKLCEQYNIKPQQMTVLQKKIIYMTEIYTNLESL